MAGAGVLGPSAGGDLSPLPSPAGGRGQAPAEVETEYEEEDEESEPTPEKDREAGAAVEVEEDISTEDGGEAAASASTPAASSGGSTDYVLPERNREVWKQFGYNNEAGRMLRRLYNTKGQSDGASKVSYPRLPSPSQRWEPAKAPRKPCPQRAPVRVPRVNRQPTPDRNDPRNWRAPIPCRKPAAEIFAEMEANQPEVPDLTPGRDQVAEKQGLQDRFQFCGGRMMPRGAMGYVEPGEMPEVALRGLPGADADDGSGMDREQRAMFEELMQDVKGKQERLDELDAEEAKDPKPSKAKTARNKEALQLRNDIQSHLRDIDKLLEITDQ